MNRDTCDMMGVWNSSVQDVSEIYPCLNIIKGMKPNLVLGLDAKNVGLKYQLSTVLDQLLRLVPQKWGLYIEPKLNKLLLNIMEASVLAVVKAKLISLQLTILTAAGQSIETLLKQMRGGISILGSQGINIPTVFSYFVSTVIMANEIRELVPTRGSNGAR